MYFCLIGTQNTMLSCQKYTPPDSFFSDFAGWEGNIFMPAFKRENSLLLHLSSIHVSIIGLYFEAAERYRLRKLSPLSANVGYIRHDTVVTSDKIMKNFWHFRVRAWNFLQNSIQNFALWLIDSWEIALQSQIFDIFLKKAQKKLWHLKRVKQVLWLGSIFNQIKIW